jgi:hypothetical protein
MMWGYYTKLYYQHAITITEKFILCPYGHRVGAENPFAPGKRGNHHNQGGLRQMEVRQHRVADLEFVGRIYEYV